MLVEAGQFGQGVAGLDIWALVAVGQGAMVAELGFSVAGAREEDSTGKRSARVAQPLPMPRTDEDEAQLLGDFSCGVSACG